MGSVPVNTDGTTTTTTVDNNNNNQKGFAELNYHKRYEHKEVRDGVVGEGQGLSEEDESRINEVVQPVAANNGREKKAIHIKDGGLQRQQQLSSQGGPSSVCWERFLPLRTLKVLLVENDDSTRQVVSALLRNCSYEVTAVANGVQAWRILQDLTNHIDLILTEVVMPCVSGIGLLCKIMNHKTCKNIPVIMMSSHDSMGIVFKCLSKGAVDFLVKPIRKNELKNLWQHVWRRCHSSSGSGSESGIQTQKSAKSKNAEGSDNNSGSNDEDDNGPIGLGARDGSDNGSGTQSSWTKRAVEVDSPQPTSPWNDSDHPQDSTCAQVIHPKPDSSNNEWVPTTGKKRGQEGEKEPQDDIPMGKDLEIGVPRNTDLQHEYASENVCINQTVTNQDKLHKQEVNKSGAQLEGLPEINRKKPLSEPRTQTAENTGSITKAINPQEETRFSEALNGTSRMPDIKDKDASDAKELPSLELSLKRLRGAGDAGSGTHDERNVLRRSDLSAFSRYNTGSANQTPTGNVGSCSPPDNSSDAMKIDSVYNQQSNGSSNNNDMGSTTKNVFTKPAALNEKSVSTSTAKCLHPSAFQPVQSSRTCPPLQAMPQKVDDVVVNTVVTQPRGAQQQVQVQHHHHHYHHHHHHVHDKKQPPPPPPAVTENDELSLSMATADMQCGSSSLFAGPIEGNGGNYSLNGSASGSNHGSNGQNGSSKAVNVGGMNTESDNGLGGKSEAAGASGSGSGSGMDQNRSAQREAALTKFRLKRKERCFEKKVRYQSRKKLAEQRPRVRGQFVRQVVYEHTSQETNS